MKLSALSIWGKVVLYLREHNDRILHVMCGDIRDVEFSGDTFVISSEEDSVINMLNEKSNQAELNRALEMFGVFDFVVQKKKKLASDDENIQILNKFFDNIVEIE